MSNDLVAYAQQRMDIIRATYPTLKDKFEIPENLPWAKMLSLS